MKIFDAHVHSIFHLKRMYKLASESNVNFSLAGLKDEMGKNNVIMAAVITNDRDDETPLSLNFILEQTKNNPDLVAVCGINPKKMADENLTLLENAIKSGSVRGIKIYLGYYPFYPYDPIYDKVYKIAEKFSCPVIFHTGDIADKGGLVKYAHPLCVDEVAVKYPKVNFVLAHAGNPWIMDAAEVAFKNDNVLIDLSGFHVGNQTRSKFLENELKLAYEYVANPEKFLYGSDWPYIGMKNYIEFIKRIIPAKDHSKVFFDNAKRIFNL